MDEKKQYLLKCRRCGRTFWSAHHNTLFCDLPSPYPEDKGRTCKEMRRVEAKKSSLVKTAAMQQRIIDGNIVISERYGCITKSEWMEKFYAHLRKKFKIGETYSELQNWVSTHAETVGSEYDKFQKENGMKME